MFGVRVSAVIPALNEAENLPHVLPRVPEEVDEILLVDGHSTDGTCEIAREVCPRVRIILQEGKGKGAALRTGARAASGDIIVMLDADGSTDPAEIPSFIGALVGGADFAKGSRFLQGAGTFDMPLIRRMANWGLVQLTNALFGTRFTDITYGYNATWRANLCRLALEIDGWSNEIVTNIRVARYGLRVVEIASVEHRRIAGEAKLQSLSAGWTILRAILAEASNGLATPESGAMEEPLRSRPSPSRPMSVVTPLGAADPEPDLPPQEAAAELHRRAS